MATFCCDFRVTVVDHSTSTSDLDRSSSPVWRRGAQRTCLMNVSHVLQRCTPVQVPIWIGSRPTHHDPATRINDNRINWLLLSFRGFWRPTITFVNVFWQINRAARCFWINQQLSSLTCCFHLFSNRQPMQFVARLSEGDTTTLITAVTHRSW